MKAWLAHKSLGVVSLLAALALTAQAEWSLALAVGWSEWVAWAAPVALDSYVIASFRAGKDRGWALGLMAAAVFMAHAAPVAFPAGFPWWLAGGCSIVPPIVAWRIHELRRLIAGEPVQVSGPVGLSSPAQVAPIGSDVTPGPAGSIPPPQGSPAGPGLHPLVPPLTATQSATPPRPVAVAGTPVAERKVADQIDWLSRQVAAGRIATQRDAERAVPQWSPKTAERRMAAARKALTPTGGPATNDESEREELA